MPAISGERVSGLQGRWAGQGGKIHASGWATRRRGRAVTAFVRGYAKGAASAPAAVAALERALADGREDEARALGDLRAIRERETYRHSRVFGVYDGTLSEIGTLLREQAQEFDWIPDDVPEEGEPPFTDEDFRQLLDLLQDRALSELESANWFVPALAEIQAPNAFETHVASELEAGAAVRAFTEFLSHPDHGAMTGALVRGT